MQSFLGEGGKGGNALNKVSQREGVDNSLFRDRFGPQAGASSSQQPFRPGQHHPAAQQAHPPQPFNLSHLSAALGDPAVSHATPGHFESSWNVRHAPSPGPQILQQPSRSGSAFASEFQSRPQQGSNWADSFQPQNQGPKGKGRAVEPVHSPGGFAGHEYGGSAGGYSQMGGMGMNGMGMGMGMGGYQSSFQPMYSGYHNAQYQPPPQQQQSQSAMSTEKSMEDAFEAAMSDWKAMGDEHKTRDQETAKNEAKDEQKTAEGEQVEDRGETKGDLEKVWESLTSDETRMDKLAQWEKDFSQFTNDDEQDDELLRTLNESLAHPDVGQAGLDEQMRVEEGYLREESPTLETLNYDLDNRQKSRAYEFTLPNRLDSMETQDAWTQANHLLNSGGSLTDATLMLESYIRRGTETIAQDPTRQLEAWSLLGRVHAMNEKEEKALSAFEEGRQAIQGNENSAVIGEMLTNLAISHVNESSDLDALQVLHQFLVLVHPTHAGPAPTRESVERRGDPWASHQEVTDMFLELARQQYSDKGIVDPDVQVGLGTLYYMMGEYGEATDCWTAALGERPNDYLLWNRLGATLANGGSPEEAVDAYRRALELKPLFTRATFNLGVACLNIGVHKEAAEHFLAALSMHAKDAEKEQRDSTPIWLTLRRALIAMDMLELSGKARPGADLNMFRQAGFEF